MDRVLAAIVLASVVLTPAFAQDRDVLYFEDFEEDTGDFVNLDPTADLTVTNSETEVFAGRGSLQLSYVQAPMYPDMPEWGVPGSVFLPLPDTAAGFGEIGFALRSEVATPVVVMVSEGEDGPRYNCILWSSDAWQEFMLTPDDFVADHDGPVDPNGQLDPSLVNGFAILDGHGIVRLLAEEMPLFYIEPAAEQRLWLDEFALRAGEPPATPEPAGPAPLASYTPPMRGFLMVGGRDVAVSSEEQGDGDFALRVDYSVPAQTLFGILHTVPAGTLADANAIRLHVKTNRQITLVVALEERREAGETGMSRYHTIVQVEAADEFEMITLPLSLFELGEDQMDPDGELNPELVETLSIADATAAFGNTEVVNTLRLKAPVVVE